MSSNNVTLDSNWNAGDYQIEFADTLIGEGKVDWDLHPEYQSIRMDKTRIPQRQRIKSLQITIRTQLERICPLTTLFSPQGSLQINDLSTDFFQVGQTLRLRPISPLGSGWEFQRAYLDDLKFNSNFQYFISSGEATFSCEAANTDGVFFTPLPFDASCQSALMSLDINGIKNALIQFFSSQLNCQVRPESAPLTPTNTFTLCSDAYQNFDRHIPRELVFTLRAVVPLRNKQTMIQQLTDCANCLHGKLMMLSANCNLHCLVQSLTFDQENAVSGQLSSIGKLKIKLLLV